MPNATILFLVSLYLLGVPFVTSVNGLSLILLDVSAIGPAYHGLFSVALIAVALASPGVPKSWPLIAAVSAGFAVLAGAHLALGFSDPADLDTLYKWYMPLVLFAAYFRWDYLAGEVANRHLFATFRTIPLLYAVLIFVSALAYALTGFEATVFEEGTLRFTGFAFAYNPTINALFLCAYAHFVLDPVGVARTVVYCAAFLLLRSKTTVAYFALAALVPLRTLWWRWRRLGALRGLVAVPLLALVLTVGAIQTYEAADPTGHVASAEGSIRLDRFVGLLLEGRLEWLLFAATDIPQWPAVNLAVGNGMNLDRRLINPVWWAGLGSRKYQGASLSKEDKTPELDLLGPLDLFGIGGLLYYVALFYVYPLWRIRLPFFRPFYCFMIFLSIVTGHVINNPQTTTLLVFFLLALKYYPERGAATAGPGSPVAPA